MSQLTIRFTGPAQRHRPKPKAMCAPALEKVIPEVIENTYGLMRLSLRPVRAKREDELRCNR
jgi:hypothetical protein